ncbi:GNAT family N-acetyltransferase [Kitasatospora sp. GP82]|uniref:GNAT family N-acetyltransferase n=1 Tax=Kitasatospora sp. GP82 TaxID=3035089 RepID=UPI002474D42C|nr:GNAT family N-acetyltransferase [Kitasatospora sp. GP82]MDH6128993.1 ribosomal-protein-alanine N-acetyltransferase [Kitasatospora sp. GP82]
MKPEPGRAVLLTGPRLAIREFHHTPGDVDALHAVFGDPETARYLPFEPRDRETCADQIELYIEQAEADPRTAYRLAVTVLVEDDPEYAAPIGTAVLGLGEHRSATIGYALRRDTWGRGYASEITALLCEFAFDALGLHRLEARVDPENAASVRVLTKAGFQSEGRIRHDLCLRGTWYDSLLFSLLEHERVAPAGERR